MLALNLNNLKETVFIYFKYIIVLIGKGKKNKVESPVLESQKTC